MTWRLVRPVLFQLPPERAHELGSAALGRPSLVRRRPRAEPSLAVEALGLRFEHPLGLAAGFDKGEVMAPGLALGFSQVEIGTLTPRPQPGNPPPRMFRLPEHAAIINRMGFNNRGAQDCAQRLSKLAREEDRRLGRDARPGRSLFRCALPRPDPSQYFCFLILGWGLYQLLRLSRRPRPCRCQA
jgi:hypothetical protein